ncbi:30S ribosomal protein S19e [archaeon]|nr:30S ribosomal protein S19e [archaeon]
MPNVNDIAKDTLIKKTAKELKKNCPAPDWSLFVKTSVAKERPPVDNDWWYLRAASILNKVYSKGPIGVSKLRRNYSAKKNRGHQPGKTYKGSGKIIRTILQQLEKAELIRKTEKKLTPGRIMTPKGRSFLDKLAK